MGDFSSVLYIFSCLHRPGRTLQRFLGVKRQVSIIFTCDLFLHVCTAKSSISIVCSVDEVLSGPTATVYFKDCNPGVQGRGIAREEVEQMMQSEAYQRRIDTCHL